MRHRDTRRPRRRKFLWTLAWPWIAAVMLAVGYVVFTTFPGLLPTVDVVNDPDRMPTRAERVDQLVERHDCWVDRAPADMRGEFPGHAVVTTASGRTVYSARHVDRALHHVFHDEYPDLTVHAFCR